jgi:hypothetical protein
MTERIHMHDQVNNKVDDIMSYYNTPAINIFTQLLRRLIKH